MLFADLIPVLYAAAVAGLAMGVALLLRRAGVGAASLAAALLIGCMFGPTVAGRVAPRLFENIAMGGPDARLAVAQSKAHALAESTRIRAQNAPYIAQQREVVREESPSIRWLAITLRLFGLGVLSTRRATSPTVGPRPCCGLRRNTDKDETPPGAPPPPPTPIPLFLRLPDHVWICNRCPL